jgi:Mrp family chromosome partitioning ATPase/capsular polysaccharide biosynthesis protein
MDIRQYLRLLRRQRWLVITTVLVVTLSTIAFYEARPAQYRATATVFFRAEDPNERFFTQTGQPSTGPNVVSEAAFVKSLAVAEAAALAVPGSIPSELVGQVSSTPYHDTGIIEIHATAHDPTRARDIATAFARAFAENRRQAAVERRKRIADQAGVKLEELQKRIAELDAEIGGRPPSLGPDDPISAAGPPGSLQAQRYAAAQLYQQIFERQQLLLVEQSLTQGGAEFAAEAALPRRPVGPGIVQAVIVAAFVGFLLAIGLAVLREYLTGRIRSREDIDEEGEVTVLAEIPVERASRRGLHVLAAAEQPLGATAEAARGLRTRLQGLEPDKPLRSILVTSPNPRDGKSFMAGNLAAVYAQAGYRTVLVSADLRRPALDALLGSAAHGGGLTGLLQAAHLRPAASGPVDGADSAIPALHNARVEAALLATDLVNLWFLPAGPLPRNPAELLGSEAMSETLAALEVFADIVVMDTPPVLAVADARALAAHVDGVLVVTALGHTPRGALKGAMRLLAAPNVRVLGTVLNKVTVSRFDSSGYYLYSGLLDEGQTDEQTVGERSRAGVAAGSPNGSTPATRATAGPHHAEPQPLADDGAPPRRSSELDTSAPPVGRQRDDAALRPAERNELEPQPTPEHRYPERPRTPEPAAPDEGRRPPPKAPTPHPSARRSTSGTRSTGLP